LSYPGSAAITVRTVRKSTLIKIIANITKLRELNLFPDKSEESCLPLYRVCISYLNLYYEFTGAENLKIARIKISNDNADPVLKV
jgi:hypothetical protein